MTDQIEEFYSFDACMLVWTRVTMVVLFFFFFSFFWLALEDLGRHSW